MIRPIRLLLGLWLLAFLIVPVSAQTSQHVVQWDPNPVGDSVLYYTLTLDTATGVTVSPAIDPTCSCIFWPLPTLANGSHTVAVSASNTWGTGPATTVTFNVGAAGAVKNVRIK